jgi:acyl-CoA reductase-like NAD-dependent aldehyde dehydrogenase
MANCPPARDHLTPQEVDLVKEAQAIDLRIAVFVHAIERRMMVLSDTAAASSKQVQKEAEKWGELPKGTRAELIEDIAQILDEAVTNIDDVAAREDANQALMQKALRKLGVASTQLVSQLQSLRSKLEPGPEQDAVAHAVDNAGPIVDAAAKLPPETRKTDKKGTK